MHTDSPHDTADPYASRLLQLGANRTMTALEDIYNAQGLKLLAAGTRLDQDRLTEVARHKLLKPLHQSVGMEGGLTADQLEADIVSVAEGRSDTAALWRLVPLGSLVEDSCRGTAAYPVVMQKLTVLADTAPREYEHALFSAWLVLVFHVAGMPSGARPQTLFLAALTHDLGYLHLPAELLQGVLVPGTPEWKMVDAHPVIGHEILRHACQDDPACAELVLLHHETGNGSGYPRGIPTRTRKDVQLLALSDRVTDLYLGAYRAPACTLRNILPAIEFHRDDFDPAMVGALRDLLLAIPEGGRAIPDQEMPAFIGSLIERQRQVSEMLSRMVEEAGPAEPERVLTLLRYCQYLAASTGILSPEYARWLQFLKENRIDAGFQEAEDMAVLLTHLDALVRRVVHLRAGV